MYFILLSPFIKEKRKKRKKKVEREEIDGYYCLDNATTMKLG